MPFTYEEQNSSAALAFVDRSLYTKAFALDSDTGVMLWGNFGPCDCPKQFLYRVMVSTGEAVRLASSGTDGRYVLRGLRPGEVTVRADESRHVGWARSGVSLARGETTRLDVLLTRGAALSGRVVDEDGRPVAGAKLSVSPGEQDPFSFVMRRLAGDPGARIASRADGTFSATRLAPGENQRLTVYHPDYEKGVLGGIALSPGHPSVRKPRHRATSWIQRP